MRKNKTGGRKYFNQTIIEAPKRKDGSLNPRAGERKLITHRLTRAGERKLITHRLTPKP